MEVNEQVQLKFLGVDFPHVNFSSQKPYIDGGEIHIDLEPKVFYPEEDEKIFRIIMDMTLMSESFFKLRIVAIGTFELSKAIHGEIKHSFVNVNAPAIMFPYLRSFISTLTSNLGNIIGTLNIPPQFFKGELEEIIPEDN
ncbi:MAG: protein-export chaperone SecB [Gammaproteobacteria bacterium]|uniref:protein-export chaperone SecB n=1 Tax=Phaeodactylibacter xiamenensis TaxID=1524460 RepID=UPI0006978595|nr:protein-export chaperone SecB [Phaeodactylibacter xiamenensis]MCR9193043.1 protein-export chaperone SecB [Gammaproteobacteria bacterium]